MYEIYVPRIKNSYILYAVCLFYAIILGCRICNSSSDANIEDEYMTKPSREKSDDNFYRIFSPVQLKCNAFIESNKNVLDKYIKDGRIVIKQEPKHPMECTNTQQRVRQFSHRDNQGDVPFAIARNVFSNYCMQEVFVGLHYSPDNQFCFALDSKSPEMFKENMRKMANCLPNVQVLEKEFKFTSGGHFQDIAHFECIRQLLKLPQWTYILLLQNNDLIIKTKSEISQILVVMNGTQLVGSLNPWRLQHRYPHELMPNAKIGKIFKNENGRSDSQLKENITYVHGHNEVFLSRDFVYALDNEVNMDHILNIFNEKEYGVDEFLLPTLAFNAHLGLPGQTSKVCWNPKDYGPVRYHVWGHRVKCKSTHIRNNLCMMTVEYLPEMIYRHEVVANKIWPASDFGSVLCMMEVLKERAILNWPMVGLNRYEELNQVQEMRERNLGTFNLKTFKCPWENA